MSTASFCGGLALAAAPSGPPKAEKRPVVETIHGVQVKDDYRWLENWKDPAVQRFSEEENAYARKYLDALPGRDAITKRLEELDRGAVDWYGMKHQAGRFFAIKKQPPREQPFLVTFESVDGKGERTLVDPTAIDAKGGVAIDWFVPSPDGKLVAVSLSRGGSESGDVHVFDVATGKETGEVIPHVNGGTAGGSLAWIAGSKGFFYTRYPHKGERPDADLDFYQQIWFHKLGDKPEADAYAVGKDFPRVAEILLFSDDKGDHVLAQVANGDGGEFEHLVWDAKSGWRQVDHFADKATEGRPGVDGRFYLISHQGAPRGKVLALGWDAPEIGKAKVIVPETEAAIAGVRPAATRLYVEAMVGGPSEARVYSLTGKRLANVATPKVASVYLGPWLAGDDVLARIETFLAPPDWYRVHNGKAQPTKLRMPASADFSGYEVVREEATSKDGTKVPISIVRKKGTKLDGTNPTLVTGYGGFDISVTPSYRPRRLFWLEHGGVLAVTNLRGGAEFGEAWHEAGKTVHKQNVFDDFAAAMQHMVDAKYTTVDKLAIEGGSNGGLLMGAMITQHPKAMKAVVSHVGLYDMVRFETAPNGVFIAEEYGTVKDPEQFKALYAYSPLHHVVAGTPYPATLMLTGANDPRVDPMHSRKFVAALQAATSSKAPILLRTSSTSGHGIGSARSEVIAEETDSYAFLFDQLGMK